MTPNKTEEQPKVNFLQVGRTIECSECFPSKDYYSCQKVEQDYGIKCKCVCHDESPKTMQNDTKTIQNNSNLHTESPWELELARIWDTSWHLTDRDGVYKDIKSFIKSLLTQKTEEVKQRILDYIKTQQAKGYEANTIIGELSNEFILEDIFKLKELK